jgi:hypothetical protein
VGHAVRFRFPLLLAVGALAAVTSLTNIDWGILANGAQSLFGGHGLDTYARLSSLQAGPPSLLAIAGISFASAGHGLLMIHLLLVLVAPAALFLAERAARLNSEWRRSDLVPRPKAVLLVGLSCLTSICWLVSDPRPPAPLLLVALGVGALGCWMATRRPSRTPGAGVEHLPVRCLLTGMLAVVAWGTLAGGAHLDDGLAMLALSAGLLAVASGRPLAAGVLVGAAIAFKPWAIVGLPLLFGLRRPRASALVAVVIPTLCWLPFVLADHATLASASRPFPITSEAAVRLFGLHSPDAPTWLRSAELVLALVVATLAARKDGWASAVPAGMVARLLLDPAALAYYSSSTVLACAIGDLQRRRPPWRTAVAWCGLWAAPVFLPVAAVTLLRAATLLMLVGSYLLPQIARKESSKGGRSAPIECLQLV